MKQHKHPLLATAVSLLIAIMPFITQSASAFTNPVFSPGADPFITYANGQYYLLCTNYRSDITVMAASTIGGLASANQVSVYQTGGCFESPELWAFNGLWYIYYTVCPNTIVVIESDSNNPQGSYHYKATLTGNTYDATLLQMPGGGLYLLGSTYGNLVIQPMSNPYTVSGGQSQIASMDQPWEQTVIEAPQALWHNGQLSLLYSSGNYDENNYAVGALKFNGGDPTNAASWSKLPGPLFTGNPSVGAFGAGAASPFYSPDGTQAWFAYSASDGSWNGDHRDIRVQQISFNPDNTPILGSPIPLGQNVPEPSNGGASLVGGRTYSITARHDGMAVEIGGGSTNNGAQADQWPPSDFAWQKWTAYDQGGGNWKFINAESGKCLEVGGYSTTAGGGIQQWDWVGGNNWQMWSLQPSDSGYYYVVNRGSGMVMDVSGISYSNGALIHQWPNVGGQNQQWKFTEVSPLQSGMSYTFAAQHDGDLIDVAGYSTSDGGMIHQWTPTGGQNQQWTAYSTGGPNVRLMGVQSGKALEVANYSTSNGGAIDQWDWVGHNWQQWLLVGLDKGSVYIIVNVGSGKVVDVSGASTAVGAQIWQWDWLAGLNQQWLATPVH